MNGCEKDSLFMDFVNEKLVFVFCEKKILIFEEFLKVFCGVIGLNIEKLVKDL